MEIGLVFVSFKVLFMLTRENVFHSISIIGNSYSFYFIYLLQFCLHYLEQCFFMNFINSFISN